MRSNKSRELERDVAYNLGRFGIKDAVARRRSAPEN